MRHPVHIRLVRYTSLYTCLIFNFKRLGLFTRIKRLTILGLG
jgi:hypothetical protein